MDENIDTPPTPAPGSDPWARTTAGPDRRPGRRRFIVGASLALALTLVGTSAWALDRFVVDHVEISNVTEYEAEQAGAASTAASEETGEDTGETVTPAQVTDSTYDGSNPAISIEEYSTGSDDDTVTY